MQCEDYTNKDIMTQEPKSPWRPRPIVSTTHNIYKGVMVIETHIAPPDDMPTYLGS